MSDYDNLQLVGRHVPEPGVGPFANAQEAQAAGYDTLNPVTGMYEIGALIDGQFVVIISEKAGLIFDQIAQGKANAQAAADAAPAPPPAETMTGDPAQPTGPTATPPVDPSVPPAAPQV